MFKNHVEIFAYYKIDNIWTLLNTTNYTIYNSCMYEYTMYYVYAVEY